MSLTMSERGDIIDRANDLAEREAAAVLTAIRNHAARIPVGNAGECELCGEWSGRLVNAACAPCRDKYKLP
jgi:hypothetical protein